MIERFKAVPTNGYWVVEVSDITPKLEPVPNATHYREVAQSRVVRAISMGFTQAQAITVTNELNALADALKQLDEYHNP